MTIVEQAVQKSVGDSRESQDGTIDVIEPFRDEVLALLPGQDVELLKVEHWRNSTMLNRAPVDKILSALHEMGVNHKGFDLLDQSEWNCTSGSEGERGVLNVRGVEVEYDEKPFYLVHEQVDNSHGRLIKEYIFLVALEQNEIQQHI